MSLFPYGIAPVIVILILSAEVNIDLYSYTTTSIDSAVFKNMNSQKREFLTTFNKNLLMLHSNNKRVIHNLTRMADDNLKYAWIVVMCIEDRIKKSVNPDELLPMLYLIDNICKNIGGPYNDLFEKDIISMFTFVFLANRDAEVRKRLYKLRDTWGKYKVFTEKKLLELDVNIQRIDSAWPVKVTKDWCCHDQSPITKEQMKGHILKFSEIKVTAMRENRKKEDKRRKSDVNFTIKKILIKNIIRNIKTSSTRLHG